MIKITMTVVYDNNINSKGDKYVVLVTIMINITEWVNRKNSNYLTNF